MSSHPATGSVSIRTVLAVCAAAVLFANTVAAALDFNDIVALRQNNIPDAVIVTMLQQQGGMTLTPEEERILRAGGASDSLLSAFRPAPAAVVQARPHSSDPVRNEPITPLSVTEMEPLPAVYSGEGWLSISNSDWEPYYLAYDAKSRRMVLSDYPNGGVEIAAGSNRAVNIRKGTYRLYGESGRELKVHIREHEVTYLSLAPFGVIGNSGLTGVARDRERSRQEVLIANWSPPPPVVVQPAPVVVVPAPRPPVYYYGYGYDYYYPRGRGFSFGYDW